MTAFEYLAFKVSGEDFAVSLLRVQEVSILGPVTRVPGAGPAIRGVLNLRGSVIPIVDLTVRLGRPRSRITRRSVLIHANALVEGAPTVVGLVVDALNGIFGFSPEDVLAPPPGLFARERDLLVGLGRVEGRLLPLLAVDALVDPSRLRAVVPAPAAQEDPAARTADAARGSPSAAVDATSLAGPIPADAGPLVTAMVAPLVNTQPPQLDARVSRMNAASAPAATPHRIPAPIPVPAVARPSAPVLLGWRKSRPAKAPTVRSRAVRTPPAWPPPEPPASTALGPPPPLPSPELRPMGLALPDSAAPDRVGPDRAHAIPPLPEVRRGRVAWVIGLAAVGAALVLLVAVPRLEDWLGDAQLRRSPRKPETAVPDTRAVAVQAPVPAVVQAAPSGPESHALLAPSPVPPADRATAARHGTLPTPDGIHEVRPGDTLWALSRRYYGIPFLWPRIFSANRDLIGNPDRISPGERLRIPPRR